MPCLHEYLLYPLKISRCSLNNAVAEKGSVQETGTVAAVQSSVASWSMRLARGAVQHPRVVQM